MKNILIIIIVFFILASCSKNEFEKELIGTWNNYPTFGKTDIKLYKDSVVSYEYYVKRKGTWKANSSQINFHFPEKLPGYHVNLTLDYKLSKRKDSLFIKNTTDSIYIIPVLLKVNDIWKHYLKEIDLQIDLPKTDFELTRNNFMELGIDLYVGFRKGNVVVKSSEFENLDELKSLVFMERSKIKEDQIDYMNFNLIIDKNIADYKIDSIKEILNQFPNMKTFRVYANDNANYGKYPDWNKSEYWNWYGKFE